MKLDKKIKNKIDKYFEQIDSNEFVNLLESKYNFELENKITKGISIADEPYFTDYFDSGYKNDFSNEFNSEEYFQSQQFANAA